MLGKDTVGRILVALAAILALLRGFAPEVVPMDTLLLIVVGIAYAAVKVDVEDATGFLVLAIAVGVASRREPGWSNAMDEHGHASHAHGVLTHIPYIGEGLTGTLGGLGIFLYAGVAAVSAIWVFKRLKG